MSSGGNNVDYFPENQLNKVSAVLQFKHAEKMKSCFVGLLCCFVGKYSLHREGNLLYWTGSGGAQRRTVLS